MNIHIQEPQEENLVAILKTLPWNKFGNTPATFHISRDQMSGRILAREARDKGLTYKLIIWAVRKDVSHLDNVRPIDNVHIVHELHPDAFLIAFLPARLSHFHEAVRAAGASASCGNLMHVQQALNRYVQGLQNS